MHDDMILYNYIQYAFRVQQKECANWRVWGYSNRRSIFFFVIKNKLFSMVIQYLQGFTNTECVGSRYSWLYGRCCSSCIIVREYVPPSLLRRSAGGHAFFFYWKVTQKNPELRMNILPSMRSIRTSSSLGCLYVLGVSSRMVKFEHETHAC
jgi:hypothetical protein